MNLESAHTRPDQTARTARGVQAGKRYTITLRGEPIADLIPAEGAKTKRMPRRPSMRCASSCARQLGPSRGSTSRR